MPPIDQFGRLMGFAVGEIAHGKPHQPPELIVHAADRVPGGFRPRIDAERQPAVPGKVLQLDRTDEYWRREAFDSVESDVFDSSRELGVEIFALHRVAGD